ncbi:MAG: endonuclease/exonuclease/phosphatase family protein, partial [Clostridia bacterium]|nr:endonuclease/exonuclease/phosphatase family protein [Clostridia bacterium]
MSEKVKKKKTLLQKILIGVAIFMAAVIFIVGSYVAYVFIAFHRLGDYDVTPGGTANLLTATVGTDYSVVSYNVGFGAYEVDYDFFMDGGTQSWAKSKDGLIKNLENITDLLKAQNADMYLLQEIDYDSTRTYHVDEREYFINALENKSYTFAQNYDSPFLFYPFYQPHGASKSGIMVFSPFKINSAKRIELPIETGVTRIIDYDRCYVKNRVSVSNGKELIIYT